MRPALILAVLEREFQSTREGHHTPVMLWGPPGVGKSQMVAQVARKYSVPVIDIRLSQMEPTDLRGIPFRVGYVVEWAIPAMLPDAQRHGAEGILFLDEITSAAPTVSAAAYQLILDRRLGAYTVPEGWAIFAAGNRQGDRGVTYSMPALVGIHASRARQVRRKAGVAAGFARSLRRSRRRRRTQGLHRQSRQPAGHRRHHQRDIHHRAEGNRPAICRRRGARGPRDPRQGQRR